MTSGENGLMTSSEGAAARLWFIDRCLKTGVRSLPAVDFLTRRTGSGDNVALALRVFSGDWVAFAIRA